MNNIPILLYRALNYLKHIPPRVPAAVWNSLKNKAPLCCSINYIIDRLMLIPSGYIRGYKRSDLSGRQYVPCVFHSDGN